MSALSAALAAYARKMPRDATDDQCDADEPTTEPQLAHQSSASSTHDLSLPSPLSLHVPDNGRPNEHLAVLLPKQLWKPDALATVCDNFFCRAKFTLFERRHHCRKCGGVFCKPCSSRLLPLLDIRNLPFLHPPRNVPLTEFESPSSPIVASRVCDDCYDQISGSPSTPRTPDLIPRCSSPISMSGRSLHLNADSGSSSYSSGGPSTPPSTEPSVLGPATLARKQGSLRTMNSQSSLKSNASHPPPLRCQRATVRATRVATLPEPERSYGELDAYPLRRASLLCKASGGGRWEPKQSTVLFGYRVPIPGGKAPYEVALEKEAALERKKKENPVIRDGDFKIRFYRDPEPHTLARSLQLSTF